MTVAALGLAALLGAAPVAAAPGPASPGPASPAPASPAPTTTTAPPAGPARWPTLAAGDSYGVDVSSYQGQISFTAAAQNGVAFAYIKATEGSGYVNPYFQSQWGAARAAGIGYGAYHFFSLCSSGAAQATSFLATVPHDPSALPPAVDLELQGNCLKRPKEAKLAAQLGTFVSTVEKAFGRKVILYVGWDFAAWYQKLALLRHRPLWLDDGPMPDGHTVVIWQSPDPAQVDGIPVGVDLDIARLGALRAD